VAKSLTTIPTERIDGAIFFIRGEKVMLDRDLARLYNVSTSVFNQAVKRHQERFPEDFMFRLTIEEARAWQEELKSRLRSQSVILKRGQHVKHLPYAFTEHGVLMLSNVLKSGRAIEMSIKIIDVFVKLREMLSTHKDILLKLEQLERKVTGHDEDIQLIFKYLKQLLTPPEQANRQRIGFKRQTEKD